MTTAYHLEAKGQVELDNREIKGILIKVVNKSIKDYLVKLIDVRIELLKAQHDVTKSELTFHLLFGFA